MKALVGWRRLAFWRVPIKLSVPKAERRRKKVPANEFWVAAELVRRECPEKKPLARYEWESVRWDAPRF